jgi:hypothetical protein
LEPIPFLLIILSNYTFLITGIVIVFNMNIYIYIYIYGKVVSELK